MEEHTSPRTNTAPNTADTEAQLRFFDDLGVDPGLLHFIRDGINGLRRIGIRFNGRVRLVEPHRLWLQDDGSYLLEAYQIAGGSVWGELGDPAFRASPRGGFQGWLSVPVEAINGVRASAEGFQPRQDYKPDPHRRLGSVDTQIELNGKALIPE